MLHLDYRDARPIYEQVKDGLRKLMVTGVMQEGEKLPSVRALAATLAINPNTIQKAYEALEAEGYVYSVAGKGSFVAPQTGVDESHRRQLLEQWQTKEHQQIHIGQPHMARLRALKDDYITDTRLGEVELK
jgi:GntR family transcriptional regulator